MSISAISGGCQVAALAPVQGGAQVQAAQTQTAFSQAPDQVELSQAGSSMSQLMQLQKSDPDRFKQVAQKISDNLATTASASGDPQQAQILTEMSQKFAASAQTGAMPDLYSQNSQGTSGKGGLAQALGHGGQMISDIVAGVGNIVAGHAATALLGLGVALL